MNIPLRGFLSSSSFLSICLLAFVIQPIFLETLTTLCPFTISPELPFALQTLQFFFPLLCLWASKSQVLSVTLHSPSSDLLGDSWAYLTLLFPSIVPSQDLLALAFWLVLPQACPLAIISHDLTWNRGASLLWLLRCPFSWGTQVLTEFRVFHPLLLTAELRRHSILSLTMS